MQSKLQKAFENTAAQYISNAVPDMPDHSFSKEFEKKMKHLIKYGESLPKRKITVKKLFICITAAIIAASLMILSVGAVRDYFKNYFMKIFDAYTTVKSADYEDAPTSIESIYTIDVPDGFELAYEDELADWSPFFGQEYYRDSEYIFFTQYVKAQYDVNVNTEDRPLTYICINGYDGYIIDLGNDEYLISWDNGEYIFDITSNIGQKQLIDLAESVHKAE